MGLECNSAALASRRATKRDLTFIEKSIEEIREEVNSGRLGTEADTCFHMAIAYATKNPVQVFIMKNFYDFLFVGIKKNLSHLYQDPDNIKKILEQHTEIFNCIKQKNIDEAYKIMQKHIKFVLNYFRDKND